MIFLLVLACIVLSCSLDRTNPLDPNVSGIQAPPKVTGIFVSIVNNYWLHITWNDISTEVNGYYIYRSMSHDGFYELIKKPDDDDTTYDDINVDISNNIYWYKMSAYSFVGDPADSLKLEGLRSRPHTWGAK